MRQVRLNLGLDHLQINVYTITIVPIHYYYNIHYHINEESLFAIHERIG